MTDAERLAKMEQAYTLIRQVEFSYPIGSFERTGLFKLVCQFSLIGWAGCYVYGLKKALGLA